MLIELRQNKTFTLQEVQALLPVIVKITRTYKQTTELKMQYLEQIAFTGGTQVKALEAEIDQLIQEWKLKISKLGGRPAGLWIVDFDNGSGYFCWKYPEEEVLFTHGYLEGFTSRRAIQQSVLPFQ
jgi:hypothetical protein